MVKRILFWTVFVVALAIVCSAAIAYSLYGAVTHCGVERQAIKISADQDAQRVNFTPEVTTIAVLTALPAPTRAELNAHSDARFPAELKTYTVTAYVVGFKLESDEDFHIVLADTADPKRTLIAEMPSGNCVPPSLAEASKKLRSSWQERFGKATPRFRRLASKVKVEVTGVGFFDFLHGQTGVAPNGFELHRVLSWKEVQ